jgi:hypothetical protein
MEKWIGLALIVFPTIDISYRYSRGKSFRKLKEHQDIPFVRSILKQTRHFYEPQWWHRICIGVGIVLLIGAYI